MSAHWYTAVPCCHWDVAQFQFPARIGREGVSAVGVLLAVWFECEIGGSGFASRADFRSTREI